MSAEMDTKQAYLDAVAAAGDRLPGNGHAWVRELRERARTRFAETGFPTTREEAWRYTNLAPLARQRFVPLAPEPVISSERLHAVSFDGLDAYRLVFVNGRHRPELSVLPAPGERVVVGSLGQTLAQQPDVLQDHLGRIGSCERGALAALNTAFLADGAYVRIPAGADLERPIHLVYVSTAQALAQPHTLIVVEAGGRATVLEQYLGWDEGRYFTNALTEVALERGAAIEHYRLQQENAQGYHIGGLYVRQARDSDFTSHAVDLGGLLVRTDLQTVLGEGAACTFNGLYVAGGRQHVDNHTLIEHAKPRSTSRELYKGVLDGRARAVFNGRVVVHPDAQQSDAQQVNNNLLLSEDAEVDTKPELEIYADDVKCAHGATVGQLDPDQLYYLRARALDEAAARDLLTFAFAHDVLHRFRLAPLRAHLDRDLVTRLLQGRAIKELELV